MATISAMCEYMDEVARLESAGLVERQGPVLADPRSGKAFTSDYDLFDIRQGTATGEAIEYGDLPADIRMRLEAGPIEVQHGAHLDWKEIPAKDVSTFVEPILKARATSAEPELLIEFHPDGRIRYTYFVD